MFKETIYGLNDHKSSTALLDISKAYVSIDHEYLLFTLDKIKLPNKIINFIKKSIKNMKLKI